jgi:YedE family putative selenium metabolism protein
MSSVPSSSLWKLLAAGVAVGVIASLFVAAGNPGNMGVCVACFVRDIAGTFGGARLGMGGVAYLRPEVLGIVLGALGAAALSREFRPRGGVALAPRFFLGFVFMVSAWSSSAAPSACGFGSAEET